MHITTSMGLRSEACDEGGALPSHPGPVQGEEHLVVGAGRELAAQLPREEHARLHAEARGAASARRRRRLRCTRRVQRPSPISFRCHGRREEMRGEKDGRS
jgi:hypothetical protein